MDSEIDFTKKRYLVFTFIVGIVGLSITADKCRQMIGDAASSKSGKFTIFNCFDGGSGTTACLVKEGVKLYSYNIRSSHVEKARNKAIEKSLIDTLTQGLVAEEAAKLAQKEGIKAAKLARRKTKRIVGPIISSGWDFFEAIYYGGTVAEGALRGTGTLIGTYIVGYLGEQKFGRFGYLVGSELGSWVGARIGLMVYDVVDGVAYLLQFVETVESVVDEASVSESYENEESEADEIPFSESDKGLEKSHVYETPEATEDWNEYESPSYGSSEVHDEF